MRWPDGSTSDPAPTPPLAWRSVARTTKRPGPHRLVGDEVDADRAHEVVALLAGVLAGRLDELGLQHVVDVVEAGQVARAELDLEVVGHDPPALDVDGALVVHLPHQPPPELDGADGGARPTEHALDHTLQAPLQRLQTHRWPTMLPVACQRPRAA